MSEQQLPVVVVGAGPVGLAAAAHLLERGLAPLVLERGDAGGEQRRELVARPRVLALGLQHRRCRATPARTAGLGGTRPRAAPDRRRARRPLPQAAGRDSGAELAHPPRRTGHAGHARRVRQDEDRRPRARPLPRARRDGRRRGAHPGSRRDRRERHLRHPEPARGRRRAGARRAERSRTGSSTASPTCSAPSAHATPAGVCSWSAAATPPSTPSGTSPSSAGCPGHAHRRGPYGARSWRSLRRRRERPARRAWPPRRADPAARRPRRAAGSHRLRDRPPPRRSTAESSRRPAGASSARSTRSSP